MSDELDITVYKTESGVCLVPFGRIVGETGAVFQRVAETHLSHRIDQFIINLSNVEFIDSTGLGVLVGLKGRCAEDKVDFLILEPTAPMAQILAMARLDLIFNILHGMEAESLRQSIETEENKVVLRERPSEAVQSVETVFSSASDAWADKPAEEAVPSQTYDLCRQAMEKVRLGEFQRAAELYQQALALDPECLPALNNLAIVYEKKPAWTAQAIETWEKVLAVSRKLDDLTHSERADRRLRRLRALPTES